MAEVRSLFEPGKITGIDNGLPVEVDVHGCMGTQAGQQADKTIQVPVCRDQESMTYEGFHREDNRVRHCGPGQNRDGTRLILLTIQGGPWSHILSVTFATLACAAHP